MLDSILVSIVLIVLGGSILGIIAILARRIPDLIDLLSIEFPKTPVKNLDWKNYFLEFKKGIEKISLKIKEKTKIFRFWEISSFELFLQKILSKGRVLILKIENKIAEWLYKLRERTLKKKRLEKDNYWEELKKNKDAPS